MNTFTSSSTVEFDPLLIRKYDQKGPRYTSYPTADRFVETFKAHTYETWLRQRDANGIPRAPLALYFHLPFCDTVCYYCACNKIITRNRSKATQYLTYLTQEIALQSRLLQPYTRVEQLHWGGGTPTFLGQDHMGELMKVTREHFELADEGQYSIEIDPRRVDEAAIAMLREIGFNRVSLGVQDFDPEVQRAVNRLQSEEQTLRIMEAARCAGFKSVSIDLIYGLPRQTVTGFERTLEAITALDPDRLSIYNYAHLPQLFKPQRRINQADLPQPNVKLEILQRAINHLTGAGYVYIGMDHFAKPDDELAIAQAEGCLQRNFQGYSTHADCDLIAMGITAIGKIGPIYSQNVRTLDQYYTALDRGDLPILRGLACNADDLLRRAIIQALMCHFELPIRTIELAYTIDFQRYFAVELKELRQLEEDGLVSLSEDSIAVTPKGRLLIRTICMAFDKYLRTDREQRGYSNVL